MKNYSETEFIVVRMLDTIQKEHDLMFIPMEIHPRSYPNEEFFINKIEDNLKTKNVSSILRNLESTALKNR